jgi:hypothetical protein
MLGKSNKIKNLSDNTWQQTVLCNLVESGFVANGCKD